MAAPAPAAGAQAAAASAVPAQDGQWLELSSWTPAIPGVRPGGRTGTLRVGLHDVTAIAIRDGVVRVAIAGGRTLAIAGPGWGETP